MFRPRISLIFVVCLGLLRVVQGGGSSFITSSSTPIAPPPPPLSPSSTPFPPPPPSPPEFPSSSPTTSPSPPVPYTPISYSPTYSSPTGTYSYTFTTPSTPTPTPTPTPSPTSTPTYSPSSPGTYPSPTAPTTPPSPEPPLGAVCKPTKMEQKCQFDEKKGCYVTQAVHCNCANSGNNSCVAAPRWTGDGRYKRYIQCTGWNKKVGDTNDCAEKSQQVEYCDGQSCEGRTVNKPPEAPAICKLKNKVGKERCAVRYTTQGARCSYSKPLSCICKIVDSATECTVNERSENYPCPGWDATKHTIGDCITTEVSVTGICEGNCRTCANWGTTPTSPTCGFLKDEKGNTICGTAPIVSCGCNNGACGTTATKTVQCANWDGLTSGGNCTTLQGLQDSQCDGICYPPQKEKDTGGDGDDYDS